MALIKCPECGIDVSSKAPNCPKCGCPIAEQKPQVPKQAFGPGGLRIFEGALASPTILGIFGAILAGLGVFMPFIQVPIMGSLNYFGNARGDGTIILVLAFVAAVSLTVRLYMLALLSGLAIGGILFLDLSEFASRVESMRAKLSSDLANNPFRGLAEVAMHSVQVQIGAYIIALGAILILVASLWGNAVFEKSKKAYKTGKTLIKEEKEG